MEGIKVGLIGFGRIAGLFHLRALTRSSRVHIAAVAEPDPARRQEALELCPGATGYADFRELLDQGIAAVVICTPPALHAEMAIAAFQAGCHVYLEKPLATTLEDGEAVLAAWRAAGTVGMLGFNFRFNPLYRFAHDRLAEGALGVALGARTVFSASARTLPAWKESRRTGGGVLLDLGSHHVDLARHLFGAEVAAVQARIRSERTEDDTATVQLQLSSGVLVQSLISMTSVEDHRFDIYGTKGKLEIDRSDPVEPVVVRPNTKRGLLYRLRRGAAGLHPQRLLRSSGHEPSFATSLETFADAAAGGRLPAYAPTIEDGWRSLAVVTAAEESARSGAAVAPGQLPLPNGAASAAGAAGAAGATGAAAVRAE